MANTLAYYGTELITAVMPFLISDREFYVIFLHLKLPTLLIIIISFVNNSRVVDILKTMLIRVKVRHFYAKTL